MVVGKVSEFIGSLYYLCVTLLRFKNIMKLKNYLLLLALLLVVGVRAQCHQAINILNVNSVEHGYRLSTASFVAFLQSD